MVNNIAGGVNIRARNNDELMMGGDAAKTERKPCTIETVEDILNMS